MSATNRGERGGEGTIADVLAGRAQWVVVEGDCLQVLPALPEKSVDVVLTDTPYSSEMQSRFGAEGRSDGHGAREALPFDALDDVRGLSALLGGLVRRWCLAFCDERLLGKWVVVDALEFIRHGVWVKTNPMPQMSGDRPGTGFESIAIMHARRERGRLRWNGGGQCAVFRSDGNNPRGLGNVVNEHPTQKPLPLMLELVELFTDSGDVVLDPFAGSCTTGVACLRLGRRFIGIEKDAKYHALARDRMLAESRGQSLREFRAGQIPLFGGA